MIRCFTLRKLDDRFPHMLYEEVVLNVSHMTSAFLLLKKDASMHVEIGNILTSKTNYSPPSLYQNKQQTDQILYSLLETYGIEVGM